MLQRHDVSNTVIYKPRPEAASQCQQEEDEPQWDFTMTLCMDIIGVSLLCTSITQCTVNVRDYFFLLYVRMSYKKRIEKL